MKPIIGIIGRAADDLDGDTIVGAWDNIRRAIFKSGGLPIVILPPQNFNYNKIASKDMPRLTEEEKNSIIEIINKCDGIILQGGNRWYEYDLFTADYLLKADIPTLGFCMGMQLLCNVDNNTLSGQSNKLIATNISHAKKGEKYVHFVKVLENTRLKEIVNQTEINVNSRHSYYVDHVTNFEICALSDDNIIEAVEYKNKRLLLAFQWHPENMYDFDENARKIFNYFIKESQK